MLLVFFLLISCCLVTVNRYVKAGKTFTQNSEVRQKRKDAGMGQRDFTHQATCLHPSTHTHTRCDNMCESTHSCSVLPGSWPSCWQAAQPHWICQERNGEDENKRNEIIMLPNWSSCLREDGGGKRGEENRRAEGHTVDGE